VVEVPCSGKSRDIPKDGLHHLTGCDFEREHFNNSFHLKVGSFYVTESKNGCGSIAEKMGKGQISNGALISFLGNASGGVLKPWVSTRARACNFGEGEVAAPVMIEQLKTSSVLGTCMAILFTAFPLYWAAQCLFFADLSIDVGNRFLRALAIVMLALFMSCFSGGLTFVYGDMGYYISGAIIIFVVFIGFPEGCLGKRSSAEEDPSEDEQAALLPNSAEAPAYAAPAAAPASEARDEETASAAGSEPRSPRQSGGSSDFALAIALGLVAGLLGGALLSFVLATMLSR